MPTITDQKEELLRNLTRLGVGLMEILTSIRDQIAVIDPERQIVALLGEIPGERRSEDMVGKTLREVVGRQAAAVHETAHARALQDELVEYTWTRGKGREAQHLATTACPLKDSRSRIVGVLMMTRKISSEDRHDRRADVSVVKETKRLLEIEQGIRQLAGAIQNYRKTGPQPFEADSPLRHLSARERQVLDLLGQGYRPRSIGQQLHVSPETVRNHLKAMFKKTGTHSQEQLTALLRASTAR